jgi:hypothetical protein
MGVLPELPIDNWGPAVDMLTSAWNDGETVLMDESNLRRFWVKGDDSECLSL